MLEYYQKINVFVIQYIMVKIPLKKKFGGGGISNHVIWKRAGTY